MHRVEIYYFSGTGNSLHAARELKRRLPDTTLVPIVQCALKADSDRIDRRYRRTGLPDSRIHHAVDRCGVYQKGGLSVRPPISLRSRRGFAHPGSSPASTRALRRQGKTLGAFFSVPGCPRITCRYLMWNPRNKSQKANRNCRIRWIPLRILLLISEQSMPTGPARSYQDHDFGTVFPVISSLDRATRYFHLEKKFYAADQCTGCGMCETVCLSGKIRMQDGKPLWDAGIGCTFCFACIHFCPAQAIRYRAKRRLREGGTIIPGSHRMTLPGRKTHDRGSPA